METSVFTYPRHIRQNMVRPSCIINSSPLGLKKKQISPLCIRRKEFKKMESLPLYHYGVAPTRERKRSRRSFELKNEGGKSSRTTRKNRGETATKAKKGKRPGAPRTRDPAENTSSLSSSSPPSPSVVPSSYPPSSGKNRKFFTGFSPPTTLPVDAAAAAQFETPSHTPLPSLPRRQRFSPFPPL